jgi:hypothetical protein
MSNRKTIATALALALFASAPALAAPPEWAAPGRPSAVPVVCSVAPTPVEADDLAFMREEEKLARDVYLQFYEQYDLALFANIAAAEQKHMDAVLKLLTKCQLPDPAAGNAIGEFTDGDLQALHDQLIAAGSEGVVPAVGAGALIEELDLEDLAIAMENTTRADFEKVYTNLACASRNHLRSFASTLGTLTGAPYVAQRLPQSLVDAILATPREKCRAL